MPPAKHIDHICTLKEDEFFNLDKLPPNASCYKKFVSCFRHYTALNLKNPRCKRYFRNNTAAMTHRKKHISSSHYYIIHPLSTFNTWRERIICLLWLIEFFVGPFQTAFCTKQTHLNFLDDTYSLLELVIYIILLMNICILFFTGYCISKKQEIVLEPKRIVRNYMKYLIVDLLGFIRLDMIVGKLFVDVSALTLEYISLLQFLKFGRMSSLTSYFHRSADKFTLNEQLTVCLLHLVVTAIVLHVCACLLYIVPNMVYLHYGHLAKDSWLAQAGIQPYSNAPLTKKYLECLYCAACHFFAAGQGSYYIRDSINEQLIRALILISGTLYIMFMLANLLQLFDFVNTSESKYQELQNQFKEFMTSKKLPQNLRDRINTYYEYKFQRNYFQEEMILTTLSEHIRKEIFLHSCRQLVQKAPIFKVIPKAMIGDILGLFKQEVFLPNEMICTTGDDINHVYLIAYGTVGVINASGAQVLRLQDGDDLGGIYIFKTPSGRYEYDCIALEMCELFRIEKKDFQALVKQQPDLIKFFERKLQEKKNILDKWDKFNSETRILGKDILSELKAGHILEKRRRRTVHSEQ